MVIVGPLVFWVAMIASTVVAAPLEGTAARVAPALVVGVVAIPTLVLLARRTGRWDVLALRRPGAAAAGIGVVLGAAVLVVGLDALAGGTRVLGVDAATVALFLLTATVLALLQEAVPEELAFRGLAFGELVRRVPAVLAVAVTTALFALGTPVAIAAGTAISGESVRFSPPGQDALEYVILLATFGVMLALLRLATGSLWAAVAGHVVFLLINRTLLGVGETGVAVALPPGGELLVLGYLLVAIVVLAGVVVIRMRRVAPDGVHGAAESAHYRRGP